MFIAQDDPDIEWDALPLATARISQEYHGGDSAFMSTGTRKSTGFDNPFSKISPILANGDGASLGVGCSHGAVGGVGVDPNGMQKRVRVWYIDWLIIRFRT